MDGTGSAGPAQPAPACAAGCAAATVLLGIPGLLVTAVTQTPDGQTLVEVITDPAFEAARCCPARREGAAPRPVTNGSQDRGGGQGAVATAGGIRTGRTQGPDGRHPG